MKQLIGLIRLGAVAAFPVALYSGDRRTQAHSTEPDRLPAEGELVLLGMDGTVIAREVNLARG